MRVLVTGAAGFVGSHVARCFLQAGANVTALVRPHTDLIRLTDIRENLELLEADLLTEDGLGALIQVQEPDVCVHLAWHVRPGQYLHALENLDSLAASLRLLAALTPTRCRRIVVVGSCAEYARREACVDDEGEVGPDTLYGTSKHAVSTIAQQLARLHGWTVTTARLFHVYGPGEPAGRMVPSLVRALLEGRQYPMTAGDQVRDLLHVEDAADALVAIASANIAGSVNVTSGVPTTIAEIAAEVGRQLGRPELVQLGVLPRRADDPQWLCARPGRLHDALGWRPHYNLSTGLSSTIGWWQQRPPAERGNPVSGVSRPSN